MWFSGSLWSVDVLGVVPVSLCIPSCRALIVFALQHINILSLSNYKKNELLIIFMSTNIKFCQVRGFVHQIFYSQIRKLQIIPTEIAMALILI